jgi:membrane protein
VARVGEWIRDFLEIVIDAVKRWQRNRLSFQAAGLAFYLALSLAPLLLILTEIGGIFVGRTKAEADILAPLNQLLGVHATGTLRGITANLLTRQSTALPTVVSILLLLVGAAGVFEQLKATLNEIWGVGPPEGGGVFFALQRRSLSVLMVAGAVVLILLLVGVTTLIAETNYAAAGFVATGWSIYTINLVISLAATTVLFGVTFKVLPDTAVLWTDVWTGAASTALLFIGGQFLIGFFMVRSGLETEYGRATAMLIILIWLYYSAQVYLFGATITRAYAGQFGSRKEDLKS